MSPDTILIVIASIVAPIIAVFVTYFIKTRGNRWRRVKSTHIPLWVIHSLYSKVFPDKTRLADGSHVYYGNYYQYRVVFKRRVAEPEAQIKNIIIYRKVRDDKT